MAKHKTVLMVILSLGLLILITGCRICIKVRNIPATPSTMQITHNNVVIKAATLSNGNPSYISIEDYYPPGGDGINELVIGWSETNVGAAEYATINFPLGTFGDGPSEVQVECAHYNRCKLEAYDKNGNLISSAQHTAGQRVLQTLTLSGGKIRRIDIIGAEIGIREICYTK